MYELMILILGALGGFLICIVAVKISFKHRTIDHKIKVFNSLIGSWVEMRNFIIASYKGEPISQELKSKFNDIYGHTQQLIGEASLVCENESLTTDINDLNESIYRNNWEILDSNEINEAMNQFKVDSLDLVLRMRKDIKNSSRLECQDLLFGISGFCPKKIKTRMPIETQQNETPNETLDGSPKKGWGSLRSKMFKKRPKKEDPFPERDWH